MKKLEDRRYFEKINEIVEWINEHKQAGGEKKESRGETISRLLKDKPECEWGAGGDDY